ncbi:hypothetical protein BSKO_14039 [Bryopsis sp. KO-2023]|nr:hypothetical protein BSKO_14039 [Bryopsis sp. KO-2023]
MEEGVRVKMLKVVVVACLFFSQVRFCFGAPEEIGDSVQDLYEQAVELRSDLDATPESLNFGGELLLKAIGLQKKNLKPPLLVPANITDHRGVLRELAKALERGQGVPRNIVLSLQFLKRAAELGDPEAHGELGVRSSYGIQEESTLEGQDIASIEKADIPKALLHYSFGAMGNDSVSQMALGYRHMAGVGVPKNCPSAVAYYNAVAEKVIELGRIPGTLPAIEKVRLSARAHQGFRKAREEQWLQFYQYSADLGDVEAQTAIGQFFNYGAYGVPRDHQQALHYFNQAAEAEDAGAMSHLGHMYANGLGVEQNNKTALKWFEKGAGEGHPNGHYGLGYMYLAGYGVKKDLQKAFRHFNKAAEVGHAEAQFHLGVMYLKGLHTRASPMKAMAFFSAAGHGGHLLAMYNLAMMQISGTGVDPNCASALKLLKQVAEKGPWCNVLQEGHDRFAKGDYTLALLAYLRAAQMGLELGQSNAAWMLEHNFVVGSSDSIQLALQLYKGSAEQDTTGALLSIGDIYFYGRGIEKNWDQSAAVYRQAEKKRSARAAFNLGFMYEYGAGVPKDLHMARRYYDLSYEYNGDAFYAAKIAAFFLTVHSWWEGLRTVTPALIHSMGDTFFTLRYADHSHVPAGWWSGRRADRLSHPGQRSIVEKVMAVLDFDAVGDLFQDVVDSYKEDDVGELAETLVLGALVVVFLLMFRRRQNNQRGANRNAAQRGVQMPMPAANPFARAPPPNVVRPPESAQPNQPTPSTQPSASPTADTAPLQTPPQVNPSPGASSSSPGDGVQSDSGEGLGQENSSGFQSNKGQDGEGGAPPQPVGS